MRAVCVDDERKSCEYFVSLCEKHPMITDAVGFTKAREALDFVDISTVDMALLDINMPDMDGIRLAMEIKKRSPQTKIIFLTAYSEYALDALKLHVSGYIMKPVIEDEFAAEVDYALSDKGSKEPEHITVQTFGGFDLFVDGKLVSFKQAKCKELFAYLIDRHGSSATRKEIFAILWEDRMYDRSMQKQLDVIIRSMRETLIENGIEEIFEMKNGSLRIASNKVSCDAYRFFDGDINAVDSYRGEYMNSYSWASITESYMTWKWGSSLGGAQRSV